MDMYRAFLAILISFVILLGYQYFFVGPAQLEQAQDTTEQASVQPEAEQQPTSPAEIAAPPQPPQSQTPSVLPAPISTQDRSATEIEIETDLYIATLSEQGGVITSFHLKNHRETNTEDSPGIDLVKTQTDQGYPLTFSWGSVFSPDTLYTFDDTNVSFDPSTNNATVTMRAVSQVGLEVIRTYVFNRSEYLIEHDVSVVNNSGQVLQGAAGLHQVNMPFGQLSKASNWLFRGPSMFGEAGGLEKFKLKKFDDGPITVKGQFDWVAYEGTYFLCGILPVADSISVTMNADEELVSIDLVTDVETLAPQTNKTYQYRLFYGPKKLTLLNQTGYNLGKIVNFGWFDVIAKPMLYLLNWLYSVFHNYGISIILVTVILKAAFWPITQKGLKSMKNMQKLQPKVVKLKEKYKNDPTKMNQEMMGLYKAYKVNPLGGCLPMVLQIPVFFSLYKVLLQSIELRHAPFMLWINDLSAPDRLYLGFDIPYLGGLPVLTLLMGASMFLQQKMTPTTADPTQARIMMFLPLIFTVMFVNFASGLVLYWFINNLLSILQQYLINRQSKSAPAAG